MRIGYLTDQRLGVHSAAKMLSRLFGEANVCALKNTDITKSSIQDFQLIFLPGAIGEEGICDELMSPEQRDLVFSEVSENGLPLWTDCMWTYRICDETRYEFRNGQHQTWQGYGWVHGDSEGPAIRSGHTEDIQLADITFYNPEQVERFQIGCHNGPGLIVNRNDPHIKIIADYQGLKRDYVAALTQKTGRGLIMAQGVLPQVTFDHAQGFNHDPVREAHRKNIEKSLAGNHNSLIRLQDYLAGQAKPYMEFRHARIA